MKQTSFQSKSRASSGRFGPGPGTPRHEGHGSAGADPTRTTVAAGPVSGRHVVVVVVVVVVVFFRKI